jgi:hypothetical protein
MDIQCINSTTWIWIDRHEGNIELAGMRTCRLIARYTLLSTRRSTEVLEALKVKVENITS